MRENLAFCALFPEKYVLNKFIIAFSVNIDYIVSRRDKTSGIFWNEVFFMLAVIGACGAAYFAGMILMTVKGMKE